MVSLKKKFLKSDKVNIQYEDAYNDEKVNIQDEDAYNDDKVVSASSEIESIQLKDVLPDYDGKSFWQVPHLRRLTLVIFIISIASTNNGYDGSLFNGLFAEDKFMNVIGNVRGVVQGALSSGYPCGAFIASFFVSYFLDKKGRKWCIVAGNLTMLFGIILQTCSGAWIAPPDEMPGYTKRDVFGMMLCARVFCGIGVVFLAIASPALISELSYPTYRTFCTSMFNTYWFLGAIFSSWCVYLLRNTKSHWSWRLPTLLQGIFPIIQLALTAFIPESPRFLVGQGKIEEARALLLYHHAGNNEEVGGALVDYELTEIQLAIEQERYFAQSSSYFDFVRTIPNKKRLWTLIWMAIVMQLSGVGLVSFYMGKVLDTLGYRKEDEKLLYNAIISFYNFGTATFLSLCVVSRFRRRSVLLTAIAGMLLSFIVWTVLAGVGNATDFRNKSLGTAVLVIIYVFSFFSNMGTCGFPHLYVTEILPFSLRAKGMNIFCISQTIVTLFNGFVNPLAIEAIGWKYYICYVCIGIVNLTVVYFTFVETSGRTLEEVAEVFGDGQTSKITMKGGVINVIGHEKKPESLYKSNV
ncbi:HHR257Wp [Eremothecium sinecaudum]|uniref:HHR257Wp n=1 Tax=Eremothecium sinecaudum TaxID=45286 RepID=A0A120K2Y9_9SACH|nr:HHR257Wp [Eremothecium sinecaudum]AMD23026.1 HHR257Wp [Eremothecium sinecaudum]